MCLQICVFECLAGVEGGRRGLGVEGELEGSSRPPPPTPLCRGVGYGDKETDSLHYGRQLNSRRIGGSGRESEAEAANYLRLLDGAATFSRHGGPASETSRAPRPTLPGLSGRAGLRK